MYKLIAYDKNNNVVVEHTPASENAAYIGFDIWCDGSIRNSELNTDKWDRVELVNTDTDEVILSSPVVR